MAKNNIYLGTLSGKLGDNVFWRTHGQQRVRTYFKKEDVAVGYEAAERQSRFANLKSIYQWLPEPFRKACNLYRVGGNPYADFMRQYPDFSMGRDKAGFGQGRFLPVNCSLSNGTLAPAFDAMLGEVRGLVGTQVAPVIHGITLPSASYEDQETNWSSIQDYIMRASPWIKNGDYLHIVMAWVFYNGTTWGEAYAVDGFPFAYNNIITARLKFDPSIFETIPELTNGTMCAAFNEETSNPQFAIGIHPNVLNVENYGFVSVVGAVMVERPTNSRQRRYSGARLLFDRSQLKILNPNMQARWNEYAAQSFMRTT